MAGLMYELTLAAFGVRANGWFCGVSRGRMWAVSGDDFGDRVRGCPILDCAWGSARARWPILGAAVGVIVCGARAMGRFSRTCRCARWALSGARCGGEKEKGSSDAEGAIGWTKNRKHGRMSDEIRAWGWGVKRPCASVVSRDCGSSGHCRVDDGRRGAAGYGKVVVFGRKRGRL